MTPRPTGFGLLLTAALATSLAAAAPADSTAHVKNASAPAGTDARYKAVLNASLQKHLNEAKLDAELAGYSISPSLIQLRRYVGPAPGRVKLVCVVGLALEAPTSLVAEVRGNAATSGTSPVDAIDAATRSAVARLPRTLAQLRDEHAREVAAR